MSDQLPLRYGDRYSQDESWEQTLEHVRRVVAVLGLKEVAFRLDTKPSLLAHQLAERNGNRLSGKELQSILAMSCDQKLADSFVASGGFKTAEAKPLTPEQKLARLEVALASLPEPVRRGLLEEAGL